MMYNITFGDKNTWTDWRLTPTAPPTVPPPEPVTNLVEIPGRVNGLLDLTGILSNGETPYKNREGSWDFIMDSDFMHWSDLYDEILNYLHGKRMKVILSTDISHYFMGRFAVDPIKIGANNATVTVKYSLEPLKYNLDGTGGKL